MTDFPIGHSQSADAAGKIAAALESAVALYRAASSAIGRAATAHLHRRALRRAPEEILAAQARREEARRAVDRLLHLR